MGKGMKAWKKSKPEGQGKGMQQQLAQVQMMQQQMASVQDEIDKMEASASSGGGAITATVNGKREIVSIKIEKDVVDPEDVEMLQDLIMTAVNEALRQMEEIAENEMSKVTGGLGIPGL